MAAQPRRPARADRAGGPGGRPAPEPPRSSPTSVASRCGPPTASRCWRAPRGWCGCWRRRRRRCTSASSRPAAARWSASTATGQARWTKATAGTAATRWRGSSAAARRQRRPAGAGRLPGRAAVINLIGFEPLDEASGRPRYSQRRRHRPAALMLAVQLADGSWLNAQTFPQPPPGWALPSLVSLGLSAGLVGLGVRARRPPRHPADDPARRRRRRAGPGRGPAAPAGGRPGRRPRHGRGLQPDAGAAAPVRRRPHPDAGGDQPRPAHADHLAAPAGGVRRGRGDQGAHAGDARRDAEDGRGHAGLRARGGWRASRPGSSTSRRWSRARCWTSPTSAPRSSFADRPADPTPAGRWPCAGRCAT